MSEFIGTKLTMNLGERSYDIIVKSGSLENLYQFARLDRRVAVVTGVETLHGAPVRCTDLRGGAALCVAALAAEGETRVSQICHIDRGYEDLARDLRALGADAVRVEETENG